VAKSISIKEVLYMFLSTLVFYYALLAYGFSWVAGGKLLAYGGLFVAAFFAGRVFRLYLESRWG